MKLTRAASYALHAVVYIANKKREKEEPIASHKIAKERDIPDRFLLKVLKPLVQEGVLQSVKGPHGGYSLAKPASEITMLEILEIVEGGIKGTVPIGEMKPDKAVLARLNQICDQIAEQTRKQLAKVKISELITKE